MANYKTIFFGTESSETSNNEITCAVNQVGEIHIEIKCGDYHPTTSIYLDKSTAIKFAKTLRTNINKITY